MLTAAKRLADATDLVVECAKACASNSTNLDSWEQVEWDRMDALRSASVNIRNILGETLTTNGKYYLNRMCQKMQI